MLGDNFSLGGIAWAAVKVDVHVDAALEMPSTAERMIAVIARSVVARKNLFMAVAPFFVAHMFALKERKFHA